jgi:hypothetical protein
MYDKPKGNLKGRRPLPWWALALILLLGTGVLLWAVAANSPTAVNDSVSVVSDEALFVTATYIIEQATATAQAVLNEGSAAVTLESEQANMDALYLTATYVIVQATQMAVTSQAGS